MSIGQSIGLLVFLCLVMLVIPFGRYIRALVRYIVHREPLVIEEFYCHVKIPEESTVTTIGTVYNEKGGIMLKGHILILTWKVRGAWRVDLEPVGRDLRGNAAKVVLDPSICRFSLKAYGIFAHPVSAEIEIPQSRLFQMMNYEIALSALAEKPIPLLISHSYNADEFDLSRMARSEISTKGMELEYRLFPKIKEPEHNNWLVEGGNAWKSMNRYIERNRILNSYNFSTKKYPNRLS